jgi:hypothetical protein
MALPWPAVNIWIEIHPVVLKHISNKLCSTVPSNTTDYSHLTNWKIFLTRVRLDSKFCTSVWSIALYGAETFTLRAVDQKHLESFGMWCWRRMEKISWTDHVRNEDVLLRVKEQSYILHKIRKRKAKGELDCHILRRNCLLQRVTEGKIQGGIEVTGRQGRRPRKLLDDLEERRGYSHLNDRTMWRARFGRYFGPVVRQTT